MRGVTGCLESRPKQVQFTDLDAVRSIRPKASLLSFPVQYCCLVLIVQTAFG